MYYRVFATFFIVLLFSSNISAIATGGDPPASVSVTTPNQNGDYIVSWTAPFVCSGTICLSSMSISAATPLQTPTAIPTIYSYRLYVSKNGGSWTTVVLQNAYTLSHAVVGQTNGSYQYSVKACTFYQCSPEKFSNTVVVGAAPPPPPSSNQVIFIHTDLLGTPSVETDENGDVL